MMGDDGGPNRSHSQPCEESLHTKNLRHYQQRVEPLPPGRQRHPEHRNHPCPRHIHLRFPGIGKVKGLAVLATIDLSIRAPGLFRVPASLFQDVGGIEPALQMAATEFSLLIFLVAGALPRLLDLDLVLGKLRNILRARSGHFASRQRTYPRWSGPNAARFSLTRSL